MRNGTNGFVDDKFDWQEWQGGHAVNFSRGKGFFAVNNHANTLSQWVKVGLPSGNYCNLATSDYPDQECADVMWLNAKNRAQITLEQNQIAYFTLDAAIIETTTTTSTTTTTTTSTTAGLEFDEVSSDEEDENDP